MNTGRMRAGWGCQAAECDCTGLILPGKGRYLGAMRSILITLAAILAFGMPGTGHAQSREVPYWASLRAEVVNMRVGPSQDYRIEWVYRRQGLPVQAIGRGAGRERGGPDGEISV